MTKQGHLLLERNGCEQYEVSAFARPEYALHNLNYWEFGDYLGIGAGAHGKLTSEKKIVRTQKSRVPTDYLTNTQGRRIEVSSEEINLEFSNECIRLTNALSWTCSLCELVSRLRNCCLLFIRPNKRALSNNIKTGSFPPNSVKVF